MKPDSKRAQRRHSRWRMVQRALRTMRTWSSYPIDADSPQRLADNLRICSCWCCSNRKRHMSGPTMRERRYEGNREVAHDY